MAFIGSAEIIWLTRLLDDAGIGIASRSTHMAREFNHLGKPVTTQAVRNWINGEAIPAGDKIRALAKWLKASPHWLHYGENEKSAGVLKVEKECSIYGEDAVTTLPEDFQCLTVMAVVLSPMMKPPLTVSLSPSLSRLRERGVQPRYASFTLTPKHKVMVCEIVRALLREEKR